MLRKYRLRAVSLLKYTASALALLLATGNPSFAQSGQNFQNEPNPQQIDNGSCWEDTATFGSVLRLGGYLEPPSPGSPGCSGVLLSPTIALTSAHCLPAARTGTLTTRVHIQRRGSTVTPCITWKSSDNTCVPRIIDYVKHPDYVNVSAGKPVDTEDDIAVLHIRNNSFRLKNGAIDKSHFARLYNDVWHRSKRQLLTGFGPCNESGDWPDLYREVAVDIDEDDFEDKHYRDKATTDSKLCKGDSGGPAFIRNQESSHPLVVGLNSNAHLAPINQRCTKADGIQRFTKISPKAEWVSQEVAKFTGKPCRKPFADTTFNYLLCFD